MDGDPRPEAGGTGPPIGPQPRRDTSSGWGVKLFLALVIVGFGAAGYAGIKTYLDTRSRTQALEERGVEADATVESVTEVSGRRIETYHRLDLSYDPPNGEHVEFTEVLDCSGARWEEGLETMRIVYLPEDPEVVRLQRCRSNFDTNVLPGIIGLVFGALALFMAWRSRGMWRS